MKNVSKADSNGTPQITEIIFMPTGWYGMKFTDGSEQLLKPDELRELFPDHFEQLQNTALRGFGSWVPVVTAQPDPEPAPTAWQHAWRNGLLPR